MTTIQVQVSDEVINKFGLKAVQERLQKAISLDKLKIMADEIHQKLMEANINQNDLVSEARSIAWKEFKAKHLNYLSE